MGTPSPIWSRSPQLIAPRAIPLRGAERPARRLEGWSTPNAKRCQPAGTGARPILERRQQYGATDKTCRRAGRHRANLAPIGVCPPGPWGSITACCRPLGVSIAVKSTDLNVRAVHRVVVVPPPACDCIEQCPVCSMRCLGGPARYRDLHMCRGLHQWGARPEPTLVRVRAAHPLQARIRFETDLIDSAE